MFCFRRLSALFMCALMLCLYVSCGYTQEGQNASEVISGSNVDSGDLPDFYASSEPSLDVITSDEPSDEISIDDTSTGDESEDPEDPEKPVTPYIPVEFVDPKSECNESFYYISPKVEYISNWEMNGMELCNTEFRMSDSLAQRLSNRLNSFGKVQSVVLIELETDMAFTFKADSKVATASAVKGPLALYLSKCIDAGLVSWETALSYMPRHFQANSTGVVQNYSYGTSFSVKTLIDYMIRISDNQAYLMLKELIGAKNFNKMIEDLGGTQVIPDGSNWGYITGYEMAMAWREIYYYSKFNENGVELFDRFMHAMYNYIYRSIPQYEAAHKSGWSGKAFNDAGVVFADGHEYVLVVLCGRNGLDDDSSQYHFTYVTKLLAELMVEYNAYLEEGINPGVE